MGDRVLSSKYTIALATLLTVSWLLGLFFLVGFSEKCVPYGSLSEVWLACLKSNEIGDFVAGGFAPLAFLWLVVTVLIQSSSLRTQSAELELTRIEQTLIREELQMTRYATEAQLKETKKNLKLIDSQIEIEKASSKIVLERQTDDAIVRIMTVALRYFNEKINGKRVFVHKGKSYNINCSAESGEFLFDFSIINAEILNIKSSYLNVQNENGLTIAQIDNWLIFYSMINGSIEISNDASKSFRVLMESFGIFDLHKNLSDLLFKSTE